jgi:hypothetical protein
MENKWTPKEKMIMVSIITSLLIISIYSIFVYKKHIEANPEIINNLKFWGKSFLILIPISIAAQIIIHIIFIIINKIVANEEPPPLLSDEMDKLIELKSKRISHWIFIAGFLLAMGSLVLEMPVWVMFVTLIYSGFLAAIVSEIAKIYFYRRGV